MAKEKMGVEGGEVTNPMNPEFVFLGLMSHLQRYLDDYTLFNYFFLRFTELSGVFDSGTGAGPL